MLIAVIKGPTIAIVLAQIEKAKAFADLFELRLDCFSDDAFFNLSQIQKASPLPFLFTHREHSQGGKRKISEQKRFQRIETALQRHPSYFDLEADTDPKFIEKMAKKYPKVQFIGSYHNFENTPDDLDALFSSMQNPHFSFYKIAVMAKSSIDMLRLMAFQREKSKEAPLSCISMGEFGLPSRILGKVVGNRMDYAATEPDEKILHRHSLKTLHDVFHYRALDPKTKIFALLGDPVTQSKGDVFHNQIFHKKKQNAVYVKLRLTSDELSAFFNILPHLPFAGLSITAPLKEKVLPFLDHIDSKAAKIKAVNTVTILKNQKVGTNTDAKGALDVIEKQMKVKGKKIAILGAGGAARGIAFEATQRGAKIFIFNRTISKARQLGEEVGAQSGGLNEVGLHSYDMLINTISQVQKNELKFHFPKCDIAMDIVYHPRESEMLKTARERGCFCIYGEEMFQSQALLQQSAWEELF